MEIDITLPQQAYAVFESIKYTEYNAIGEFIDNSIQSYLNNEEKLKKLNKDFKLRINLILSPDKLEIYDNASGIDEDRLKKGLKPATKPDISGGLSEFGMGMKTAAFWICRKWSLITKHFNSNTEFRVDFDNVEIYTKGVERVKVYPTEIKNQDHYTKLILEKIIFDGADKRKVEELKENLSSMYRCYLRENKIEIYLNGTKLEFPKSEFLKAKKVYGDEKEVEWKKEIDFKLTSGKRVTGFAGLLKTGKPTESGFAYIRKKRVIDGLVEGIKIVDIQSTANTQLSRRLFAEIHLDDFRVSHTKDAILFGNEEFEFQAKLKETLDEEPLRLLYQGRRFKVKDQPQTSSLDEGETLQENVLEAPSESKELEIKMNFQDTEVDIKGDLNKIAEEMKEAYGNMYKIENIIRTLVKYVEDKKNVSFLDENHYSETESKKEIRKIKGKIDWLKNEEIKEGTISIRGNNDLFYTTFDVLKTIIEFNYDEYFSDFFIRKNDVISVLEKLYSYRNNIAHHSYLSKEEINYIEWALNVFFFRQLAGKMSN